VARRFIPPTITDDSALGGNYDIERSLIFLSGDSTYLRRTPSSSGTSRTTFTISLWWKPGNSDENSLSDTRLFSSGDSLGNANYFSFSYLNSTGQLNLENGGASIRTTAYYRDVTAWYHAVVAVDSTQSTATDRFKLYINGQRITDFSYDSFPPQNQEFSWNHTVPHSIGREEYQDRRYFNGHITEIHNVDGQQLPPTAFGYTDFQTNIWRPIKYRGTYGTNGFYLNFSDNSSTSALGYDKSGNGNNFSTSGFSLSTSTHHENYSSVLDTPTNNFPTWNPYRVVYGGYVYDANYKHKTSAYQSYPEVWATMGMTRGKWYCEFYVTGGSNGPTVSGGVKVHTMQPASDSGPGVGYQNPPNSYGTSGGSSPGYGNGTLVGITYDAYKGIVTFYKNGSLYGSTAHDDVPTNLTWFFGAAGYSYNPDNDRKIFYTANFGQRPFTYTPPTGFVALCQKNLDLLSIDTTDVSSEGQGSVVLRPQKFFDTLLYSGTGSTQTIGGLEFSPDFVWIKKRNEAAFHQLFDTVRGATRGLFSNSTNAEYQDSGNLQSFVSGGFTADGFNGTNASGGTYVAWCWKAGGAAVANNDGAIASSVSVNKEAGFSIVGFQPTAASTAVTIGHGLGVAPHMIIVKSRGSSANWDVFHNSPGTSMGADKKLYLNGTNSEISSGAWGSTLPTNSVFTFNPGNQNNNNHIAYCWHSVPGYSKIGVYRANGSANGPYEHLGFKPAWIMIKNQSNSSAPWYIIDNKRSPHNERTKSLKPNVNDAEATDSNFIDFYSMGFKLRTSGAYVNGGNTSRIIYMAFAEQSGRNEFGTFANAG
tara:strand:+ start:569 stop:3013 length:2445 start_codon:yes stop_codon:yes gene_type:complete